MESLSKLQSRVSASVDDLDLAGLSAQIEGMQEDLAGKPAGDELDRANGSTTTSQSKSV